METILNYLENMFAALPKTKQIKDLKEDLLSNMEDKYNELKRSGRSENEAIGIVISEFGNIDELIEEFNIKVEDDRDVLPALTEGYVNEYLQANKRSGIFMGAGVFLCVFSTALFILINQLVNDGLITGLSKDDGNMPGLLSLFLLIAIGVGMLIHGAMYMGKYKGINSNFEIPVQVGSLIENKTKSFHSTYIRSLITGTILSILSPIVLFIIPAMMYGVVVLLFVIAVAAYIFVYYGWNQISYKKLIEIKEGCKNPRGKAKDTLSGALWIFIIAAFLVGILSGWRFSWILFIFGAGIQVLIESYFQLKTK